MYRLDGRSTGRSTRVQQDLGGSTVSEKGLDVPNTVESFEGRLRHDLHDTAACRMLQMGLNMYDRADEALLGFGVGYELYCGVYFRIKQNSVSKLFEFGSQAFRATRLWPIFRTRFQRAARMIKSLYLNISTIFFGIQ